MYAVIKIGNRQYKVQKDQVFLADKTGKEAGSKFNPDVLMVADGSSVKLGSSAGKVSLEIVADVRGEKIDGFKYKKRKNYSRRWGHRQDLQKMKVVEIAG